MAVAMLCLVALSVAEMRSGRARAGSLLLAAALAAIGILVRIEGLALVPPVLFVAVGKQHLIAGWRLANRRPRIATALAVPALLALVAVTVLAARATSYSQSFAQTWQPHGHLGAYLHGLVVALRSRVFSLAILDTQGHCCVYLSHRSVLLPIAAGLALLVLLVLGWLVRRRLGAIEVFVLSTAAIIFVYGAQARFWLAARPFMIVYAYFGLKWLARFKIAKVAIVGYLAAYAIVGAAWLVKSVQISTSGRSFPHLWTNQLDMAPPLADAYFVAFGEASPGANRIATPAAVELLRRYEPLARQPARRSAAAGLHNEPSRVRKRG
jgi:hypothetical protein